MMFVWVACGGGGSKLARRRVRELRSGRESLEQEHHVRWALRQQNHTRHARQQSRHPAVPSVVAEGVPPAEGTDQPLLALMQLPRQAGQHAGLRIHAGDVGGEDPRVAAERDQRQALQLDAAQRLQGDRPSLRCVKPIVAR
eukprot:scaffold30678_cov108-Isochrysis_galbana.AAC.4